MLILKKEVSCYLKLVPITQKDGYTDDFLIEVRLDQSDSLIASFGGKFNEGEGFVVKVAKSLNTIGYTTVSRIEKDSNIQSSLPPISLGALRKEIKSGICYQLSKV